jgi:hypothetical protein
MKEIRDMYRILIGKSEEMRPLGRHQHKQNNIKTDLKETESKYARQIHGGLW